MSVVEADRAETPDGGLEHVPDALRRRVLQDVPPETVLAAAEVDRDGRGEYAPGYLVLTADALGRFAQSDGEWRGEWQALEGYDRSKIVEGLGVHSLRVFHADRVTGEHRFTLRCAREVARLHRRLEKLLEGKADEARGLKEPQTEDKKSRCEKCSRVIPSWAEHCPACISNRKILYRLLDFVRPYRLQTLAGCALAIVLAILSLIRPWLTKPLFDRGLGAQEGVAPDYDVVVFYTVLLAGLILIGAVGEGIQRRMMGRLGSRVARSIRDKVYRHLQHLSLSYFSRKQTGSLVSRVTTDSDRLWDFIAFTVVELAVSILTVVGVGVALFWMHWKLAFFVLLPVPLMLVLMTVFHKKMHRLFDRWTHRWHDMTSVVTGALPGVRVIKAFSQEEREIRRFESKNGRVFDEEMGLADMFSVYGPLMVFTTQIGSIIIWLLGGWWVVQGEISAGTLVAYTGYMMMFYRPIHMLAHMDRAFNRAATSAQRIFEVLDTAPSIFTPRDARPAESVRGEIEFRHVSFSYDGVRKVLKDIDLHIQPGEMIGLAGPSGGGKTTTINLVCRFYDALEGEVLIDGVDVRDYDLGQLRGNIGVVLQEPFLFHGTVAQNIAYGNPDATLEEILTAAKAANAHDFIVGFPDGYDTLVGERGHTLSGGELQRVSIARAILHNPRILILDEATSSVDTETESLIQEALDRLVKQRTTIAIAHRLSTLRKADRLVILEGGEIKEVGSHEELCGKPDGIYAKLLRMQAEAQSLIAIQG